MKTTKLTDNLQMMLMGNRAVDVVADLPYKPEYAVNSFFVIGHFESRGHTLNYLYHLMLSAIPGQDEYLTYCFSVTDETTGEYRQYSHDYAASEVNMDTERFNITTPKGSMAGTLDGMHLKADVDGAALDLELTAVGYPLYNCESGKFFFANMDIFEYSIPTMLSNGTIRLGDETFEIKDGVSWFDRQWQIEIPKITNPDIEAMAKMQEKKSGSFELPV